LGPVRNATGFALFEFSLGTKWLELLKELAPGIERAAVLRDAAIPSGVGQWDAISSAAASLGVQLSPVDVRDAAEIEREITTFARLGNGGLIIQGSPLSLIHRELIIAFAARHKLDIDVPATVLARADEVKRLAVEVTERGNHFFTLPKLYVMAVNQKLRALPPGLFVFADQVNSVLNVPILA